MAEAALKHSLLGGKLHVYRRERSGQWQCSTYLAGKNHRVSTKTDSLSQAKEFAQDWYLTLHGKHRAGELKTEKTFRDAAAAFEREYEVITEGQRSPAYVRGHKDRIRLHLNPFFGAMPLSEVTAGAVQEYRIHRRTKPPEDKGKVAAPEGTEKAKPKPAWKPPARTTLHHEFVTLRQVLKTALRRGWLSHLPDLSAPYKTSGKITHRAWFSPEEYRQLYRATRTRANDKQNHRRKSCAQLHDFVLFMANTGLRPDEAARLEYRDVRIVEENGETILEIEVRGKRGVGFCKSTAGAVRPFERIRERNLNDKPKAVVGEDGKRKAAPKDWKAAPPKPTDRLFPTRQTDLFNEILEKEGLKSDRDGQVRTSYSLRHTYICMRLMEGADIYQIAKNCRTSVEMIEKFYAAHIRTRLNAAAINVRRSSDGDREAA
jgi:integrase